MTDIVDHDGIPLFVDEFTHTAHEVGGISIDVIKTNGNLWLSGPSAMEAMGFQPDGAGGGYGRRLSRIDHPDIIKITDTPFRFTDGRRNRGSLISPRAVHRFAEGRVKGFNAIRAYAFLQWMEETPWTEGDEETWSPKRPTPVSIEPVFRQVIRVTNENEFAESLDPLRPIGKYHGLGHFGPLRQDEVEFKIEADDEAKKVIKIEFDDDELIDEADDFSPWSAWTRAAA